MLSNSSFCPPPALWLQDVKSLNQSQNPYETFGPAETRAPDSRKNKLAWVMWVASLCLYVASLFFSCYHLESEQQDWSFFSGEATGFLLLLIGWIGVFCNEYAWLANPLWLVSFALVKHNAKVDTPNDGLTLFTKWFATFCCIGAIALALTFTFQTSTHCGRGGQALTEIGGLGPGFFLWISSFVALFCSNLNHLFTREALASKAQQE